MAAKWIRMKECPICGKGDCSRSPDGEVVACWRVIDGAFRVGKGGQGLHKLDGKEKMAPVKVKKVVSARHSRDYWNDWAIRASGAYKSSTSKLGHSLGLSEASLESLGVGMLSRSSLKEMKTACNSRFVWTFPMFNQHKRPIGLRLRTPSGFKYAADGSENGLFIPAGMNTHEPHVVVCEGPTDAAAALDMGFKGVIGRPCNVGCTDMIAAAVRSLSPKRVTIYVDNDKAVVSRTATMRGAEELMEALAPIRTDISVPPYGAKDLRDALNVSCHQCGRKMKSFGNVTHDGKLWCGCERKDHA